MAELHKGFWILTRYSGSVERALLSTFRLFFESAESDWSMRSNISAPEVWVQISASFSDPATKPHYDVHFDVAILRFNVRGLRYLIKTPQCSH